MITDLALADDTIGQTIQPGSGAWTCYYTGGAADAIQVFPTAGTPRYSVQNAGRVMSWSTEASAFDATVQLEIWRGDPTGTTFTLVGIDPIAESVKGGSGLNTFQLADQIPVLPGDLLGLHMSGRAACAAVAPSADTYLFSYPTSGASVNAPFTFAHVHGSALLNVAATIAPASPTSKEQCFDGGWRLYTDGSGTAFKNQGDCVSFVASQGKNTASG